MGKFNGIDTFHDGLAVSDYVNMIPLGDTCIDRLGDRLVSYLAVTEPYKVRGSFVDSQKRIYVVINDTVQVLEPNDEDGYSYVGPLAGLVNGEVVETFKLLNTTGNATFVESSIKPSVVYMCDGKYIYKWATTGEKKLVVTMMFSPGIVPNGQEVWKLDPYYAIQSNDYRLDMSEMASISSIDWFDNKLVAVQKDKNTVWLTCTDPEQFANNPSLDPWGEQYQLWNNWYSSTNSADRLNTAVAFGGQLYLLNSNSIEVWGRTGNEDAPLQSNTLQVIHHGARSPLVLGDVMYVVANDTIGAEYIGVITQGGFKKISNLEIDHRLEKAGIVDIVPISQRGETYVMVRYGEGLDGFVFTDGKWWHWKSPENGDDADGVIRSLIGPFALTRKGALVEFTDEKRTNSYNRPIQRYIRDSFQTWHSRKLFRRVSVAMDSGRVTEPDADVDNERQIYIRLSTNRGLSFGKFYYRKLGKSGMNNKVVEWLGLGSGNSLLLEIGTSAQYKLQIYDISVITE